MKTKLKTILLLTAICQLLTANCYSLDLGFAREDGGRPGAFLAYGAGARSLAMGKTFVGVADDASATYWNPAGLATLQKPEITALYASLYEKTGYSFASGVIPTQYGTFGAAIVNLSSKGFQLRDEYNYELGEGGVNETAGLISLAKSLEIGVSSKISLGTNLKIVNQNIDTRSDTGYGMDVGLLWKPVGSSQTADSRLGQILKPLSIGLSIQNIIAPKLTLIEDTDKYPLSATLGLSYRFFNNNLLTAVDLNKTENRQMKVHLGTEYILAKLFSIRAGLDETEATFGMGVKWHNYSLDYAFAYHDAWKGYEDLGISHRFGLTVRFGSISNLISKVKLEDEGNIVLAKAETGVSLVDRSNSGEIEESVLKEKIKEKIELETGEKVQEIKIEEVEEVKSEELKQISAAKRYTVKKGDCLWAIAGKQEIYNDPEKWPLIYQANQNQVKNPDLIFPAQKLVIP